METIYGINVVEAALNANVKFVKVFIKENINLEIRKKIENKGIKIESFSKLSYKEYGLPENAKTQGVVALIKGKQLLSVKELILVSKKRSENPIILIADKITDPQNVGAILRNIVAFNCDGLIISKHNQSPINATVHKASAGNSFFANIAATKSLSNSIKELKDSGFWIVETRMDGNMNLDQLTEYDAPLAIILGSEGKGVSQAMSKKSDLSVSIEMSGKAESLNVASASAILLHALQK